MEQYLDAMIQSMDEKSDCLKQLLDMTAEQEKALAKENIDWDTFDRLIDEKEAVIDRLGQLDDGFQAVFDKIRDELEGKKALYKDRIAKLQGQIRQVTDQSNALIAAEQKNKELMENATSIERKRIRQTKANAKVATNYYNNMNRINYIDPQLMDKKK
ncbi:MAG: flagellar export chaperone FlgN [Lachnospiraceae bacterium]|nr:flagellar export chaperone FlgN [Lachnospiraceae bacterium]